MKYNARRYRTHHFVQ